MRQQHQPRQVHLREHSVGPQERAEKRIIRTIEERVFSAEAVAYLTNQVNAAIERLAKQAPAAAPRDRDRELSQARAELENIKAAIRQGHPHPEYKVHA